MVITIIQYALLKSSQVEGILFKILLAKLVLLAFLVLSSLDIRSARQQVFYKNFGISRLRLFSISFVMDTLLTSITVEILNLF